jgi:hypothetical protein
MPPNTGHPVLGGISVWETELRVFLVLGECGFFDGFKVEHRNLALYRELMPENTKLSWTLSSRSNLPQKTGVFADVQKKENLEWGKQVGNNRENETEIDLLQLTKALRHKAWAIVLVTLMSIIA